MFCLFVDHVLWWFSGGIQKKFEKCGSSSKSLKKVNNDGKDYVKECEE